jgi:hypothetical protein
MILLLSSDQLRPLTRFRVLAVMFLLDAFPLFNDIYPSFQMPKFTHLLTSNTAKYLSMTLI